MQPQHQGQHQQSNEPTCITTVEPTIVDLSNKMQPFKLQSVSGTHPELSTTVPSSPKVKQDIPSRDDQEMRRRVNKRNIERRRRACISNKLSALHSLAVSFVDEKPQPRLHQRTEIMDLLNQCVSVLQGLSKFVKSEPELQAKMRCLELASVKRSEQREGQRHGTAFKSKKVHEAIVKIEKGNVSPCTSTFTPNGRYQALTTSTPLVASPSYPQRKCPPTTPGMKRDFADSGLDCFPSLSSPKVIVSSSLPTSSISLKTHFEEIQSKKRHCESSSPDIWRPYRD
ncbi:hypothetical protein TSMEX_001621 [Taenia solium]|eukprot:TsM_001140800 transcript=TsM_001140800 gene=TsM_001140800